MKYSCYFVFSHTGTSGLTFFWAHSSSLRLTRNCPWANSVTAFTSLINTLHRPNGKHRLYCCWCHRLRGSVITEPLFRNWLHNSFVPPLFGADDIETHPYILLYVGPCLPNRCLETRWSNLLQYIPGAVQAVRNIQDEQNKVLLVTWRNMTEITN
jgi:hypothetical protein